MLEYFLGVEGGATRTVALLVDSKNRVVKRVEGDPCNLRLISDADLRIHFRQLAGHFPSLRAVGVGLAGCRDAADRARVRQVVSAVWPGVAYRVEHDLETAWQAAYADETGISATVRIIVVSGTGSCCYGRNRAQRVAKVGGWGHLLGDRGSGYDLVFTALREVVATHEQTQRWPALGTRFLRRLRLKKPSDLIAWIQSAGKTEVAALAPEVFAAAKVGDPLARSILIGGWAALAEQAQQTADRLVSGAAKDRSIEFVLCGSVFTRQPAATRTFARLLQRGRPRAKVRVLAKESAWGAIALARQATARHARIPTTTAPAFFIPVTKALSPTEQRNPRSTKLDRLSLRAAMELMLDEEAAVPGVIRSHAPALQRLIQITAKAFRQGGRLIYVGAGTSGRLGVLDASECPPTFRTLPEQVQGIMAGGERALHSAVEGAEDDAGAGAAAICARGVGRRDVVLGIAASGRTPFVWGALSAARQSQATTALLCFNPYLKLPPEHRPDVLLALDVGPEVLTGSTRLKAGTATKLVLNILTTLTMVRTGKVMGNLMVDLNPSNEKLRDRAARIVMALTDLSYPAAWKACERAGWKVVQAVRQVGRVR